MKKIVTLALATVLGLGLTVLPQAADATTAAPTTTAAATTIAETTTGATTTAPAATTTAKPAENKQNQVAKTGEIASVATGIGVLLTAAGAVYATKKRR